MTGRSYSRLNNGRGNRITAGLFNTIYDDLEADDARIDAKVGPDDVSPLVASAIADNQTVVDAAVLAVGDTETLQTAAADAVAASPAIARLEGLAPVSADWFSDINDAITAAGVDGIVAFSDGVTYTAPDPLLALPRQKFIGGTTFGPIIMYTGEAGIKAADMAAGLEGLRVSNITLHGNLVGGVGLDARGMSHCVFDGVRIYNPTDHAILWGGDTNGGGWSNTFRDGVVRAPVTGAAMRFEGVTTGNASTANNILVTGTGIETRDAAGSIGLEIISGDTNTFIGNDLGYGQSSAATIRIAGAKSVRNRFISNRTERVIRAVLIEGGVNNIFLANSFGLYTNSTYHGAEIYTGSLGNVFRDNWWDSKGLAPRVWEDAGTGAYRTVIDDIDSGVLAQDTNAHNVVRTSGSRVWSGRVAGEAHDRVAANNLGRLWWNHPTTGSEIAALGVAVDNSGLEWSNNTYIKTPRVTGGLPTASATYRGVTVMVHGAAGARDRYWTCSKDADDNYSWKEVSLL